MTLCTQSDVETILQFTFTDPSDPVIADYITVADAYVKRWLGRNVEAADHPSTVVAPINTAVVLPDYPVNELTVVEDGTTLTVGDDYHVEAGGIVRRLNGYGRWARWDPRAGRVVVSCNVGYVTVPDDIRAGTARLVARMFRDGKQSDAAGGVIKAEAVGDHSVAYDTSTYVNAADAFATSGAMDLLKSYRRSLDGPFVDDIATPTAYTP